MEYLNYEKSVPKVHKRGILLFDTVVSFSIVRDDWHW